jgi:hypothetical protein
VQLRVDAKKSAVDAADRSAGSQFVVGIAAKYSTFHFQFSLDSLPKSSLNCESTGFFCPKSGNVLPSRRKADV